MMFHRLAYLFAAVPFVVTACGPTAPTGVDDRSASRAAVYEDLQQRDDVLTNLQTSFNTQDLNAFIPLVDGDLIFHFSPSDVSGGDVGQPTMDATDKIRAVASLFGYDIPAGIRRVGASLRTTEETTWGAVEWLYLSGSPEPTTSITLTLVYPPDEFSWMQVPGSNGESWYEKSVSYLLTVTTASTTFTTGAPVPAVITVRYGDFAGEQIWRIVKWRDKVGS